MDIAPGLIWVQMATVGMEWTERFVNTATHYQVSFFDARSREARDRPRPGS
jgi:hypothetical protein